MDQNLRDIHLLKSDPDQLLIRYQYIVRIVVRQQIVLGRLPIRNEADLIQDINRKLVERIPRMQKQFSGKSLLRTYFSAIIRNVCKEELRRENMVEEPEYEPYRVEGMSSEPADSFLLIQEFERLMRIIKMFHKEEPKLRLMFKCIMNVWVEELDILGFPIKLNSGITAKLLLRINALENKPKKIKYAEMSKILELLEGKSVPADSLRKWFKNRLEELIRLMNGSPPTSAYNKETLELLAESFTLNKKKS